MKPDFDTIKATAGHFVIFARHGIHKVGVLVASPIHSEMGTWYARVIRQGAGGSEVRDLVHCSELLSIGGQI